MQEKLIKTWSEMLEECKSEQLNINAVLAQNPVCDDMFIDVSVLYPYPCEGD